jgi:hypothetical protein
MRIPCVKTPTNSYKFSLSRVWDLAHSAIRSGRNVVFLFGPKHLAERAFVRAAAH